MPYAPPLLPLKLLRLTSTRPPGPWVRRWLSIELRAGGRYHFDLSHLSAN